MRLKVKITKNQWVVIHLLSHGLAYHEIATIMGISKQTVSWHLRELRSLLGCKSTIQCLYKLGRLNPLIGSSPGTTTIIPQHLARLPVINSEGMLEENNKVSSRNDIYEFIEDAMREDLRDAQTN